MTPQPEPRGRHPPPETIYLLKGKPETGETFSGHGSQPSGLRFRCSAPGTGSGSHPYPYLITRARYLTAETRDPKMPLQRSKGNRKPEYYLRA